MPMTLVQQYVYFLAIVLMYGTPITLILLFLGWRKKYLVRMSLGLLSAHLIIAAMAVGGFYLNVQRSAAEYDTEIVSIENYVGDPSQVAVVIGRHVGHETHGDLDFLYYQFPALDASNRVLELVVPPTGVNAAAYIRHATRFKPAIEEARLIVWPSQIGLNPSLQPELFFERHVPGETAHSFGKHTLIAGLRPRDSIIVYPPQANAQTWLWRAAVLEL